MVVIAQLSGVKIWNEKKTLSLQEEERQTVFEVCVFFSGYYNLSRVLRTLRILMCINVIFDVKLIERDGTLVKFTVYNLNGQPLD